jgi:ATP-dependent DNA helicase RecG
VVCPKALRLKSKPSSPSKKPPKSGQVSTPYEKLGLITPTDFLLHFPLRYEDETCLQPLSQARPYMSINAEGVVTQADVTYRPRKYLTATLKDDSGEIHLRWLNFYPSQLQQMQVGKRWRVRGEARPGFHGLELIHPRVTKAGAPLPNTLTPVYPTTAGLTQKAIRARIESAFQITDIDDTLPDSVRETFDLLPFKEAIRVLHWPQPSDSVSALDSRTHPAWIRVKFDELLAQQLSLSDARQARRQKEAMPLPESALERSLVGKLLGALPFELTAAQLRVVGEIQGDMTQPFPMHRLLQGDVGSGKTIVAALAALRAVAHGKQAAVMAPTEILAEQHYLKFSAWAKVLGLHCAWLSSGLSAPIKRQSLADIASGQAQLIVGTQALIQQGVTFHDLGLAIVDEQHRFGVSQRLALGNKGVQTEAPAIYPHQLTMSATPIPRTLAMTFFADLDVSVIDQKPPGRTPVKTKLMSASRRDEVVQGIRAAIAQGGQVYWVCPLVEESEALQLQTATDTHVALTEALSDVSVGLIHGRLSAQEKAAVMQAFSAGQLSVLVATTVIEVGVDVPNASLMVIEHAERFGLAQLHQLRGRVGRGARESICLLLYEKPMSAEAQTRLRAMYETDDGFEIARRDLQLRGPGEFLGARQSGLALLRFADFEADAQWVERAQQLAAELKAHHPEVAQRHKTRWMQEREAYLNG